MAAVSMKTQIWRLNKCLIVQFKMLKRLKKIRSQFFLGYFCSSPLLHLVFLNTIRKCNKMNANGNYDVRVNEARKIWDAKCMIPSIFQDNECS